MRNRDWKIQVTPTTYTGQLNYQQYSFVTKSTIKIWVSIPKNLVRVDNVLLDKSATILESSRVAMLNQSREISGQFTNHHY